VTFEVVYEYYSMEISGISINPVYSMGEKLSKAGMNTLISMSVVFCVLILISLIIYAFNIFPYLENKKKEKEKAAAGTTPREEAVSPVVTREEPQNATDDTELIAVIAAAIAASEGTSTSDFVVRSINRR
jgi:Na+-transporting methylmalonyl-CoA/oxaloacetate decarboxylase gamma subunit